MRGSTFTVVLALLANLGVAVAKLLARACSPGPGALLSEAAHSFGDTTTEVFLLFAVRRSDQARRPLAPVRLRQGALRLVADRGRQHLRDRRGVLDLPGRAHHRHRGRRAGPRRAGQLPRAAGVGGARGRVAAAGHQAGPWRGGRRPDDGRPLVAFARRPHREERGVRGQRRADRSLARGPGRAAAPGDRQRDLGRRGVARHRRAAGVRGHRPGAHQPRAAHRAAGAGAAGARDLAPGSRPSRRSSTSSTC